MLLTVLTLLIQTQTHAAQFSINEKELLAATSIDKNLLMKENEKALEQALFFEENGVSCGLEEFFIDGYTITEGSANVPTKFEVLNVVTGPTNYCGGYAKYKCYTHFYKKDGQWNTLGAECDSSDSFED